MKRRSVTAMLAFALVVAFMAAQPAGAALVTATGISMLRLGPTPAPPR